MLLVPTRRQPDDVSCLPTCVLAVLEFLGREIEFADALRYCHTTAVGSDVDLAVQGLTAAGFDADLQQSGSLDDLSEWIAEGQPPIVALSLGDGWSHTVVVCDVTETSVTVMDPEVGRYVELSISAFIAAWVALSGETLIVAGRSGNSGP
jgi:ABC-type bacteriocin/lantibiotic exporter with double-glycine peptidase domain